MSAPGSHGLPARAEHPTDPRVEMILEHVQPCGGRPFVVVIDGPGGSGKSTLARRLMAAHGGATLVAGDDFYADLDGDYRDGLDAAGGCAEYFDAARLRAQVLEPARAGRRLRYERFDWVAGHGLGEPVDIAPGALLVVEGVYTARPGLRELADLVVWVETPEAERRRRQEARGENDPAWIDRWMAAERHYADHVRVVGPGDVVVPGS